MKIDLQALRKSREARAAKMRGDFESATSSDILIASNLAKDSAIWTPANDKASEFDMRVLQFQVTQPDNMESDEVGDFATYRSYAVHSRIGAARKTVLCPRTFNKPCPICDHYFSFPKEERKNKEAFAFRPKNLVIFNALLRGVGKDGKPVYKAVVFKDGYFATVGQILGKMKQEIEFAKESTSLSEEAIAKKTNDIYLYSDLEFGYWLRCRYKKAAVVMGGASDGGVAFPHFVSVDLLLDGKRDVVTQEILDGITDLDSLIPKPSSERELYALLGVDYDEQTKEATAAEDVNMGTIPFAVTTSSTTSELVTTPERVEDEVNPDDDIPFEQSAEVEEPVKEPEAVIPPPPATKAKSAKKESKVEKAAEPDDAISFADFN